MIRGDTLFIHVGSSGVETTSINAQHNLAIMGHSVRLPCASNRVRDTRGQTNPPISSRYGTELLKNRKKNFEPRIILAIKNDIQRGFYWNNFFFLLQKDNSKSEFLFGWETTLPDF